VLQNRVDPSGQIIKTSARGLWLGNRGVIHNRQDIVKPFNHKAWITCLLEFKGRERPVMSPGRWTELFFLDEATAFAAGHRPCFECRREDALRFKSCWISGNPVHNFNMKTSINLIDDIMHRERIDSAKKKVIHHRASSEIPDGTFVFINDNAYLFYDGKFHHWTPFGYDTMVAIRETPSNLAVLTPSSVVNAFSAGYRPQVKITVRTDMV
jgi:hypothetical protein